MSLYDDLGVAPDASGDEIKAAHRRAVKKHHPDKPDGDKDKFHAVQRAYDVLSDDERRARYDATGETDTSDPAAQAEREARSFVAHLVETAADHLPDVDFTDFVEACLDQIEIKSDEVHRIDDKTEASIAKIGRMLDRLQVGEGAEDIVGDALRRKRTLLTKHREKLANTMKVAERATEILSGYTYRVDTRPEQPATISDPFWEHVFSAGPNPFSRG